MDKYISFNHHNTYASPQRLASSRSRAAYAALHGGSLLRVQLSIEVMIAMMLSLVLFSALLGYFAHARTLMISTESTLSQIAKLASSYPAALPAG